MPVAAALTHPATKVHCGWPGFGAMPPDAAVKGIDDLVSRVLDQIDRPTALIAQSMGGVVAMSCALERPELLTHLVLVATSGGIDVSRLGGQDWRPAFHQANPSLPKWFASYQEDLTPVLATIRLPTLLLWGDADPISPVGVGLRLAALMPNAHLALIPGGDHDLGNSRATEVAPLIDRHLAKASSSA